jgi:hypothetical protein
MDEPGHYTKQRLRLGRVARDLLLLGLEYLTNITLGHYSAGGSGPTFHHYPAGGSVLTLCWSAWWRPRESGPPVDHSLAPSIWPFSCSNRGAGR